MITFTEKRRVLNLTKPYLENVYGVKTIGVFGSYIKGKQRKDSDFDLLVKFDKPISFFRFLELEGYLSQKLNVKVDLVTEKALKPDIGKRILAEAVYL